MFARSVLTTLPWAQLLPSGCKRLQGYISIPHRTIRTVGLTNAWVERQDEQLGRREQPDRGAARAEAGADDQVPVVLDDAAAGEALAVAARDERAADDRHGDLA